MKRVCLIVARVKSGLTQKDVAERIGVSQQSITKYENGTATPKTFKIIRDFEQLYGVKKEFLFSDVFGGYGCTGCSNCNS